MPLQWWQVGPLNGIWSVLGTFGQKTQKRGTFLCLKSPFSNYLAPFSKYWVAEKYNCHFYHRYANGWFWFYWQPMKVSAFVDLWSKVRCVCRTNPCSNAWLLAYTTVFRSLFSAPLVPFRSFFWEIVVPFWSLLGTLFFLGTKIVTIAPWRNDLRLTPWIGEVNFFPS